MAGFIGLCIGCVEDCCDRSELESVGNSESYYLAKITGGWTPEALSKILEASLLTIGTERFPVCERIKVSMNRATSLSRAARAVLAEHFELFMTTAGVLIAIMIILSELSQGEQGSALIFLVWLQGLILWAVHRHCILRNRAMVDRLRMMVQDRVNNRLTLWLSLTDVQSRVATEAGRDEREAVSLAAARAVSLELEKVSLDSLRTWERRYSRFITSWGQ
jgi:hypothetical protein